MGVPVSAPTLDDASNVRAIADEPPPPRRSNYGMVTLILGCIAVVLFPIIGVAAVMVAAAALREDPDDALARAGGVLGWIALVILIVCWVLAGALLFFMFRLSKW
jgi:hypothetical protein